MAHKLITVATDGYTNFVTLPDGTRLNLGPVSVLSFINKLALGDKRTMLDEFLKEGSTVCIVSLGDMQKLLAPVRKRWSATFPLIHLQEYRTVNSSSPTRSATVMTDKSMQDAIALEVQEIERQIALIEMKAKEAGSGPSSNSMKTDILHLKELVKNLGKAPTGQSTNRAFYAGQDQAQDQDQEALEANAKVADSILDMVEQTHVAIERLAAAGRKFNASMANEDLHAIASDTQALLAAADLSQPSVGNDLTALAERSAQMHGLFANAK